MLFVTYTFTLLQEVYRVCLAFAVAEDSGQGLYLRERASLDLERVLAISFLEGPARPVTQLEF